MAGSGVRGRVVLVGRFADWVPDIAGLAESWAPADLLVRPLEGFERIVLFLDALVLLDPVRATERLRAHLKRVVLCVGAWHPAYIERLLHWRDAGFTFVEPHRLARHLFGDLAFPARPEIPVATWLDCSPVPGSLAEIAIGELTRLVRPGVNPWAAALGIDRKTLRARCIAWFGMTPRRIIRSYRIALASVAEQGDATLERRAQVAQYANGSNYLRALRNARRSATGNGQRATGNGQRATQAHATGTRFPKMTRSLPHPALSGRRPAPRMACA